jgi:hypothetical protein
MFVVLAGQVLADPAPSLEAGFVRPPDSARPHTWWHWCNGNVTREGITADLEAMARVGVGGAQIFEVNPGIPAGKVKYLSPEWRSLIKHTMSEADRLGLEMCIHNGAGWSSSGGPWIKPEQSMQMLVTSEARFKGPGHADIKLPQPQMRVGYYRDIAVLAFPTPPAEVARMVDLAPTVTSSVANLDVSKLLDGNPDTSINVPVRSKDKPEFIQFEFAAPFTARGLTILSAGRSDAHMELQSSDDGVTFTKVSDVWASEPTALRPPTNINFAPVTAKFFRLAFYRTGRTGAVSLADFNLEAGYRINNWAPKAGYVRADGLQPDTPEAPAEGVYNHADVVDLTSKLDADGRLTWDAPAGDWTILRFGSTSTGSQNEPATDSGRGLECDKMSKEAVDAHFAGMVGKIISDLGPLVGKSFKHVLIDSYEVDTQNWTPRFREEFQKRRGYDPLPYLPVMTGRIQGTSAASERFLWDIRRTIADLYADCYYGHYAELCHQHGLKLSAETYGNAGFDNLTSGGKADIPMCEFWAGWGNDNTNSKLMSSASHIYGHVVTGAESFTGAPDKSGWQQHPFSLKALGDLMWCGGVNRFIFHTYAMQPWKDLKPGMTMGPFGTEVTRNVTWWEQGTAWMKYLARGQYLLQSGLFVGDLCYFCGENSPNDLPGRGGLNPTPPPGYDYDGCDATVILTRMSVRDGKIVLPDGMSYRMLILPQVRVMTPALIRKIADLVRDGATVVGPKPLASPSLGGFPDCDREVQTLADEVWGDCDGQKVTEHAYRKGTIVWGQPLPDLLAARKIAPDFAFTAQGAKLPINYIHRVVDGTDAYFVASYSSRPQVIEASFRITGMTPELWHPDTGKVERAPIYRVEGGRTIVPLRFDPSGSVFVVFRTPSGASDPIVTVQRDGTSIFSRKPGPVLPLVITKAEYGASNVPSTQDYVDLTKQVQARVGDNKLSVPASNDFAGGDPAANVPKQMRVDYTIDGKPFSVTVDENQTITLPAADQPAGALAITKALYGILPDPAAALPGPAGVADVTEAVQKMVVNDALTVAASNANFGDPANLIVKELRVEYTLGGKPYTRTVGENDTLTLPDGTEESVATTEVPPPQVDSAARGGPSIIAFDSGAFDATTASGKHLQAKVSQVPAPAVVGGPWEVRFPPSWGAPEKATFDHLASWSENADPGIRYFSGTATYIKQIAITPAMLASGDVLVLDLGTVHEIAQVRLNGRDLGIFWKPPFRIDLTGIAKPGANQLEVSVTNLWVNRLIGDEQLPPDADYNGDGSLRGWPAWLADGVEGKARPRTGRVTFSTWKHWSKDSPLLDSGLMGPVRLLVGRRAPLK